MSLRRGVSHSARSVWWWPGWQQGFVRTEGAVWVKSALMALLLTAVGVEVTQTVKHQDACLYIQSGWGGFSHLLRPEEFHGATDSHAAVFCDQQCNLKNVWAEDCLRFWRFTFGHVLQLFRTDRQRWLNVFVVLMSPQLTEETWIQSQPEVLKTEGRSQVQSSVGWLTTIIHSRQDLSGTDRTRRRFLTLQRSDWLAGFGTRLVIMTQGFLERSGWDVSF